MGSGGQKLPVKVRMFVYLSHSLSTWGDRMWAFGVGLFMVIISPESLRVTAIYGLSMGGAILLFGALVGDWVDRTPRLKAARTSLIIQNSSVILCAGIVFVVVTYKAQIVSAWPDEGLLTLCYVAIILVAIGSRLGSMGTTIAVQRDWIVEICGNDHDLLATMSATLRRIDLITKILAPIATGQIMTYASVGIGALFIAGWNFVSVFVEYYLLWKVYDLVPALRAKKDKCRKDSSPKDTTTPLSGGNQDEDNLAIELEVIGQDKGQQNIDEQEEATEEHDLIQNKVKLKNEPKTVENDENEKDVMEIEIKQQKKENEDGCSRCCGRMMSGFIILYRGWRTYMKYEVAFAGLGLACLYMTVLGFCNITVGYAYSQGVNESINGILMAGGAVTGILGTILYPVIRRRIGLERTGLVSFFLEVSILCLCVASVWAPGSPFDPMFKYRTKEVTTEDKCLFLTLETMTIDSNNLTNSDFNVINLINSSDVNRNGYNVTYGLNNQTDMAENGNLSTNGNHSNQEGTDTVGCQIERDWQSYISVSLLMAGIIGARCGLWMADLTITQLFLENIKESERGIINGVQASLNQLMDMVKFLMVIAAPEPEVFGILVLVSFAFIVIGWILYAKYSHGVRGHLFHFDEMKQCKCGSKDMINNNTVPPT